MDDAMQIMEELLETEYKGLIFVNENRKIGAYSNYAKRITGILLENERKHTQGRIEDGDIVIIADNELGNDDEITIDKLATIGITDDKIKKGDALVAVGVYNNKKIKPQYKYIRGYSPNLQFELSTDYLGFSISSSIDFADSRMDISVNGEVYSMVYFESVGHMVVIDRITGKVKFFQARGYGFREEEIGKLLDGKRYRAKTGDETKDDSLPTVGAELKRIIYGDEILEVISGLFNRKDGYTEKGIYEIHKRPLYCVLTRICRGGVIKIRTVCI